MLYITTRSDRDAFTTHRALSEDIAPDGGQYVPFTAPRYSPEEIAALKEKSFSQTVADFLNYFYSAKLTAWDVDFTIGRNAAKLICMNHRIAIAELWHNPRGDFAYTVSSLYNKICNETVPTKIPTQWFVISVRIAVLFGIYGELLRNGSVSAGCAFDVCVGDHDLSAFIASWYARSYGLPIGKIICAVNEESSLWDFIHRGTYTPDQSAVSNVERLIHGTLGFDQVRMFLLKKDANKNYLLDEEHLQLLNSGLFCCVTSKARIASTINSLYRSNSYITDENTAFCYGGLQDYRAKTGESTLTLLLAERTPLADADFVSSATGIAKDSLTKYINFS